MRPISIAQIRQVVGAQPADRAADAQLVESVCTDTREMQPDSLFVALRGDRFDGHEYLKHAASVAVAALVDRIPADAPPELPLIVVDNARQSMGKLANFVRRQMRATVIAVAGSNGKTSTKHIIDAALRPQLRGSISPKSYNNDIGVPLTIFPADPLDEYLVLELGTNHPGEIRPLAQIAQPDIAVITNCSAEHLEGLHDISGVRRENATLLDGLTPNGLLIVHGDDPELLHAVAGYRGRRITFGFLPHNDLCCHSVRCESSGTRFGVHGFSSSVFVPMLGRHSATNALAAIAVARQMGLADAQILINLAGAHGPEMRLALEDCGGVHVLNDAYNANPASMRAAIETLAALPAQGRRIAVVGDMRELGDSSEMLHREIGRFIARDFPPDLLIAVGPLGKTIAQEARLCGLSEDRVELFPDAAAACAVSQRLRQGDLVLLKGSRAVRLETVARAIASGHAPAGNRAS
jgi:UDP-N-acetylmuramoyl-tripeptide--D-alanyl-D-alanine ligase